VLGLEHLHTLASIIQLGSVLWSQGRLADAEALRTIIMDNKQEHIWIQSLRRVDRDGQPWLHLPVARSLAVTRQAKLTQNKEQITFRIH
jgi:hypothetical protein